MKNSIIWDFLFQLGIPGPEQFNELDRAIEKAANERTGKSRLRVAGTVLAIVLLPVAAILCFILFQA